MKRYVTISFPIDDYPICSVPYATMDDAIAHCAEMMEKHESIPEMYIAEIYAAVQRVEEDA